MKRFVNVVIAVCFVSALMVAPSWAKSAGEIRDGVYTDNDYHFSLRVPTGWAGNIKSSKSALRLAMDEKSPVPPEHFKDDLRDYMQIPTMVVIVDTTSLEVGQFVDNLLAPKFASKQKSGMLKYLKLIARPHDIQKRSSLTVDGESAIMLEARQAYQIEVAARGSDRADVVNDYKAGSIFFTVRGGNVYVIHLICEYKTSGTIMEAYNSLISSLKFGTAPGATETEKKDD